MNRDLSHDLFATLSPTIPPGRSLRRALVPRAKHCGARNRNHPDNNLNNNSGFRVCVSHRWQSTCRCTRRRHLWPRPAAEGAAPRGRPHASERDLALAR